MSVSVLDMSMSLDGYIADPNDFLGGEDGERLHHWFAPGGASVQPSGPSRAFADEWNAAGAVLAGRRTAELMDHWGGDHNGLPIFVPSHRPPGPAARWGYPVVTYVTDGIESAMAQVQAAAGDRAVQVRGAYTGPRALAAGVLDEGQIHLIPVLLGCGRRLFEVLPSLIELDIVRVIDTPEATHIRYRVRRLGGPMHGVGGCWSRSRSPPWRLPGRWAGPPHEPGPEPNKGDNGERRQHEHRRTGIHRGQCAKPA